MREGGEALPTDSIAILDSSVLIAMGEPSTEQYRAFEQHVTRRNIAVRIPDLVAEERGESPEAYTYQRDRLRAAQEAGWLERAEVDFSDPRVSETVDRTRTRMAKLSADDVREDEIEKTDTVLAGLAYQYAVGGASHVTVLVSDLHAHTDPRRSRERRAHRELEGVRIPGGQLLLAVRERRRAVPGVR